MRTLPQNVVLVLATSAILAGFIAFPKESGDAMAQFISATQRAVTTVIAYSHSSKVLTSTKNISARPALPG
jgi:hypothetical protein